MQTGIPSSLSDGWQRARTTHCRDHYSLVHLLRPKMMCLFGPVVAQFLFRKVSSN